MANRPLIPLLLVFIGGLLLRQSNPLQLSHPHQVILLLILSSLFLVMTSRFSGFAQWSVLALFFFLGLFLMNGNGRDPSVSDLADRREKVTLEGIVLEQVSSADDMARYAVRAHKLKERLAGKVRETRINAKCLLTIYKNARVFLPGDRIHFPARLGVFKNFENPGRFDYRSYMRWKGYACTASVSDGRMIVPMGRGAIGFPGDLIEGMRKGAREFLWENLPPENAGLLSALILGERQGIESPFREKLNRSGLGHVLAVSGLHIGLVAWLAFSLFKTLLSFSYWITLKTDIRKVSATMSMAAVTAYTSLAGFQVSSQRALIMALTYFSSIIIGRERDLWSTLAIAAFLVLSLDPMAVSSISFQLSFMAVAGILFLTPRLMERMPDPFHAERGGKAPVFKRLYTYFLGTALVTLSAVFFLLPVTCYYFHRISLVSVPANMTVLPILGLWVLPLGLLAVFLMPFSHILSESLLEASAWGLDWMKLTVDFWSGLPWSAYWTIVPNVFEMMLFYGLVVLLFLPKGRRWARTAIYVVLFFILADISYWVYRTQFNRALEVTFLDVGQGSSALIRFPGRQRMLVDGGGFTRDTFDVGRMVVAPYLLRSKIGRIDYLVLSHPHPDHMNGLRFIARHFGPREFWHNGQAAESESFKDLMDIIDSEDIEILLPGDLAESRNISGVVTQVFHPPPPGDMRLKHRRIGKANDLSMVLKVSYNGISFLFPGDIERAGEEVLVKSAGSRLKSDVLLVPHHGGRTSCSKAFLDSVKPRICVISVGRGNSYGFPHAETLARLERAGCRILRIDQLGSIRISIDEKRFKVESFLGGKVLEGKASTNLRDRGTRQETLKYKE